MSAQSGRVKLTRSEEVRSSNDHIAERAAHLHFVSRVPMLCECSDPNCRSIILVGLDRYNGLRTDGFFTAPGHAVEDAAPTVDEDGYRLQQLRPRRPERGPRASNHAPGAPS